MCMESPSQKRREVVELCKCRKVKEPLNVSLSNGQGFEINIILLRSLLKMSKDLIKYEILFCSCLSTLY